jgi:hypothetical protein
MEIPQHFRAYRCADYFGSDELVGGVWDDAAQLWLIFPAAELTEQQERRFLVVGRPGVGGIEFGYRADQDGFWAYYPIDRDFSLLAPSARSFLDGWRSGQITV